MNPEQELIFVYNANSNIFSFVINYLHKKISPDTYQCNLCKITYGITMNKEWREFIKNLPYKITFLHKDQLENSYPDLANKPLPTIFIRENGDIDVLATQEELNRPNDVAQLIALMKEKLKV